MLAHGCSNRTAVFTRRIVAASGGVDGSRPVYRVNWHLASHFDFSQVRTKPLLLVLPLLWYLSGVSGLAAAVCAPARAERCCCCQRAEAEAAPDAQPASLTAMMSHAT